MNPPRQINEGSEGIADPQHRDMRRYPRLEARIDQAGASVGARELIGIFEIVEKRQVHRAGLVKRRQPGDDMSPACGIDKMRLRQRGDIGQR